MILETMSIGMFIPILNSFAGGTSDLDKYIPKIISLDNSRDNIFNLLTLLGIIFTFKTIFLSYSSYEKERFSWELNNFFSKKKYIAFI